MDLASTGMTAQQMTASELLQDTIFFTRIADRSGLPSVKNLYQLKTK
ncbi:hypothetical protein GW12_14540 [Acinetobacter sp. HR7]|nr:hypothetical protein GW12_14540 [Acinetobacter sp. HR7]